MREMLEIKSMLEELQKQTKYCRNKVHTITDNLLKLASKLDEIDATVAEYEDYTCVIDELHKIIR